jgi:hypothetical protein
MFNINSLSLLVINSSNIPNFNTSSRITMSTSYSAIIDSRYDINIAYFDSLSIIISIKSILVFISRSSKSRSFIIKSIITTCYFLTRAELGYSFLYGLCRVVFTML